MGGKKLTTESWVARAKSRWGDRFDYSRVVIVDARTKVEILCPVHGAVWVCPQYHVREIEGNTGCTDCGKRNRNSDRRLSFEEFLIRARAKFGDRYTYDPESYPDNVFGEVSFTCPRHGPIKQNVVVHLNAAENSQGCPKCGREHANQSMSSDTETFIQAARAVHGDSFDYSEAVYRGSKRKLKIICRVPGHGPFFIKPNHHLSGTPGCQECSGLKPLTREVFIERARAMWGDHYTYDDLRYVNMSTRVTITCPIHGNWDAHPTNFLFRRKTSGKGSGCPECALVTKGVDSLAYFHANPEWAESLCTLYVATVRDFFKPGISVDAEKRDRAKYDAIVYQKDGARAVVWCVEQRFLLLTAEGAPASIPDDLAKWRGRNELRRSEFMTVEQIGKTLDDEYDSCLQEGWIAYAERHLLPSIGYGWITDFSKRGAMD